MHKNLVVPVFIIKMSLDLKVSGLMILLFLTYFSSILSLSGDINTWIDIDGIVQRIGKDVTTMEMRKLGKSGIEVSTIALGTWAMGGGPWWGNQDDNESISAIHAAMDQGINLIDTAPAYYFGHSEEVIGKALKGCRDKVVLATKCGQIWDKKEGAYWYTHDGADIYICQEPATIRREIEKSLVRLQTDYIDLYQPHVPAREPLKTPVEDSMAMLMQLKDEGKIRAIGICNEETSVLPKWIAAGDLATCQNKYSMLDRALEKDFIPFCREHSIGVLPYSPLEQGILTGRFTMDTKIGKTEYRNEIPWYQPEKRRLVIDMLNGWKSLTDKYGCTVAQLVIAWTVAQPGVTSVLCGARKVKNVMENAAAGKLHLEDADIAKIRKDVEAIS